MLDDFIALSPLKPLVELTLPTLLTFERARTGQFFRVQAVEEEAWEA